MKPVPPFSSSDLESIAKVMGDTEDGLTGSEIGHLLSECRVSDVSPTATKWKRIFNALAEHQNSEQRGNHVIGFIQKAMKPVKYTSRKDIFDSRCRRLNEVIVFAGMNLGEDGKLRSVKKANNITEAKRRASRLHASLQERNVHPDVLAFCNSELLEENYFHAVFEAMKSIASKIRYLSGLKNDGADLVQDAFSLGKECNPILAINPLESETDKGEQRGFVNLLIGLFGVVRNPLAHNAKIEWDMNEQDTLDILTTASLIHRKIDCAYKYKK